MYIARRTGGGRGVYEIAGSTESGITASDLRGRSLVIELAPDLRFDSRVALHVQGGKPRLVLEDGGIQIQRQIASALMLPNPRRANDGLGSTQEVVRTKAYAVERIDLDFVNNIAPNEAFVVPGVIELKNSVTTLQLSVIQRLDAITGVWDKAHLLPPTLAHLVSRHKELVSSGNPMSEECEQTVHEIQIATAKVWPAECDSEGDPLPHLANHLGVRVPTDFKEPEAMSESEFAFEGGFDPAGAASVPERVRRAIIQRRGQRSFRQALLVAYDRRCQVTEFTGEPALEAAHILPYSEGGEYTNDPRNGLLLRSDIHILFDLGLVKIDPQSLLVRVGGPLSASSYAGLDGRTLLTGGTLQPSREALAKRWAVEPAIR